MSGREIIVGWLQNDYGRLGRAGEAVAHALARRADVSRVAYVEPFLPTGEEPELGAREDRGVLVFTGRGTPPVGAHEVAGGVRSLAEMEDPILLNFGVSEANWWLHYEFAPLCSRTVLVAYDKLAEWEAMAPRRRLLERVRAHLVGASDVVCGLSQGSIDDLPQAVYVGHGVDEVWHDSAVDSLPEPDDLAPIPRPRAVYVGALSMRFDLEAVRQLADAGIEVVLIGLAAPEAVLALAATHPRVHLLGERPPERVAAYLLHCDVGIVPHTDEPFTRTMEPHKAYNYAAAGLPTVTLNTARAPALDGLLHTAATRPEFVAAVEHAAAQGRLSTRQVQVARSLSWDRVAEAMLEAAETA